MCPSRLCGRSFPAHFSSRVRPARVTAVSSSNSLIAWFLNHCSAQMLPGRRVPPWLCVFPIRHSLRTSFCLNSRRADLVLVGIVTREHGCAPPETGPHLRGPFPGSPGPRGSLAGTVAVISVFLSPLPQRVWLNFPLFASQARPRAGIVFFGCFSAA